MVWGFWHGLFTGLESLGQNTVKKLTAKPVGNAVMHVYTLLVVCLGFVMFRASDLSEGMSIIGAMFTGFDLSVEATLLLHRLINPKSVLIFILAVLFSMPISKLINNKLKIIVQLSLIGSLVLFVLCVLSLASGGFAPFIYAQF